MYENAFIVTHSPFIVVSFTLKNTKDHRSLGTLKIPYALVQIN